ncbi:MAG: hypothetical protein UW85_C0003G0042 [Parcubacteria group bacterium GW2011_GWA1_Parcubacteria_45_10]|nr:MAG: hypothetical protein UW85_C0003G0042 [Parcubacteria group bacterium GW2011_GWA1_Parcubacteria_45_10]
MLSAAYAKTDKESRLSGVKEELSQDPVDPKDIYFQSGQLILAEMMRVARMPMLEFIEAMDDDVLAFTESMNILLDTIPNDFPYRRSASQNHFIQCFEYFWKICAKKCGMKIND